MVINIPGHSGGNTFQDNKKNIPEVQSGAWSVSNQIFHPKQLRPSTWSSKCEDVQDSNAMEQMHTWNVKKWPVWGISHVVEDTTDQVMLVNLLLDVALSFAVHYSAYGLVIVAGCEGLSWE